MSSSISKLEREVTTHVETLEALYFFVQSLDANSRRLRRIAQVFPELPRSHRLDLRDELRGEVKWLKEQAGGFASDHEYRDLYKTIRSYQGYYYLDKLYVERRLFTNYSRVFSR